MTNFTRHTTKKGAYMSDREHTAKTPSHRTGIFASLSSLFRGPGSSASPGRLLAALALAIAAFALTAAPVTAA